jgi:hypothetical protein
MNLSSHYVTYADFGKMGIGHGCDPASFDDALDAYFEHRSNGLDACVMRYDAAYEQRVADDLHGWAAE